jgi:hypothetical protein
VTHAPCVLVAAHYGGVGTSKAATRKCTVLTIQKYIFAWMLQHGVTTMFIVFGIFTRRYDIHRHEAVQAKSMGTLEMHPDRVS